MASHSDSHQRKGAPRLPARSQPTPRTQLSKGHHEQNDEQSNAETEYLRGLIRTYSGFPKPGIEFRDITPLLAAPRAINLITERFSRELPEITAIAGIESRGFLFGMPLAQQLNLPFIPLRKPGKLPGQLFSRSYQLEYGEAELQMQTSALNSTDKVLLIDDLLATGGTAAAAIELIELSGAQVARLGVVIELSDLGGRKRLESVNIQSLISYTDESIQRT